MSPVLHILQFNCGLIPLIFPRDSKIEAVGFALKKDWL